MLELNPKSFVGFSFAVKLSAPDYTLSRSVPSLGFTAEKGEKGLGERKGDMTSRVFRENSERRCCHASDWINARMGCASVYLSWTVYVIIYRMFLLVRSVGDVLGREKIRTFAWLSAKMIIEYDVN